jgi:intracellular sulfur oxidation DsrE/DsrF family protein
MKTLKLLPLALVAMAFALPGSVLASDFDYGTHKVVYHVNYNDENRQSGMLRNIQNHINAVGADNMDVKVVMHGNGLSLLAHALENENLKGSIANLKMQNVDFQVCANTVRGRGYDIENDLYDASEADIIPSGVAHISWLQQQGYTYSKP